MDSKQLALQLAEFALTKKAEDIKILDLRDLTTVTDFFVICTGYSDPQVKAIADAVMEGSKNIDERVWHKEGMAQRSWILLDFVDVVVHIFMRDTRTFYGLEKLWGDAEVTEVRDENPPETEETDDNEVMSEVSAEKVSLDKEIVDDTETTVKPKLKATVKKSGVKKPAAKKTAVKSSVPKKTTASKKPSITKKASVKKAATKKPTAKKPTVKKSVSKKKK